VRRLTEHVPLQVSAAGGETDSPGEPRQEPLLAATLLEAVRALTRLVADGPQIAEVMGGVLETVGHEVRFCRYRFSPTGELKYRGARRVRTQVH
jgi:hypothetical protein